MDVTKAFWIAQRRVNFGFSAVNLKLRFETMALLQQPVAFKLCMSFVDEPTSLFTALLKPAQYQQCGLDAASFPAVFHQLFVDPSSLVDVASESMEKVLYLALRNLALPLPSLSVVFQKSSLEDTNTHLKTMIHDMKYERTLIEAELHNLRTENIRLKQKLSVVKQTDKLVQRAFEQIERDGLEAAAEGPDAAEAAGRAGEGAPEGAGRSVSPAPSTSSELILGIASYLLCAVCEKVFVPAKHSRELSEHFIQAHADDARNVCLACPQDANVLDLASHAKSHAQRVYACEYCGKKGRKHYLKSHVRTHTGEKPFKCQTCGRRFADQSTIRRHQTTVHSLQKRFVCPICGRDISRKDNYRVHLKSHAAAGDAKKTDGGSEEGEADEEVEVVDLEGEEEEDESEQGAPPRKRRAPSSAA